MTNAASGLSRPLALLAARAQDRCVDVEVIVAAGQEVFLVAADEILDPVLFNNIDATFDSHTQIGEILVNATAVGGATSFLTGGTGSSAGVIATIAGSITAAVAMLGVVGWYARRRRLGKGIG